MYQNIKFNETYGDYYFEGEKELELRFDDKEHKYSLYNQNNELIYNPISTTTLMSKHGLSVDYSQVDESILEKAREFGELIHSLIEQYFKGIRTIDEIGNIAKEGVLLLEKNGFKPLMNEAKITNNLVAGMSDMIAMKDDKIVNVDYKLTYAFNRSAVTWQSNIYKALILKHLGLYVEELYSLWYDKRNKRWELKYIDIIDEQIVNRLFYAEFTGEKFVDVQNEVLNIMTREVALEKELFKYTQAVKYVKELEINIDLLKKAVYDEMEKLGIVSYDTENFKLTRVLPTTNITYNNKKLYKDVKDLINLKDYEKETTKAGYLRITEKVEK